VNETWASFKDVQPTLDTIKDIMLCAEMATASQRQQSMHMMTGKLLVLKQASVAGQTT